MNREQCLKLLDEKLTNKNLVKHSLAVEAVMKALAEKFGQNAEIWSTAGLLHDLDYEFTMNDWTKHGVLTAEWLGSYNLPNEISDLIKAHNADGLGIDLRSKAEKAIFAVDPVTGLITAAALMVPSKKLSDLSVKSLIKKFKTKGFAKGANRDHILMCEEIGLTLEEFLTISLEAMQEISNDLGL